MTCEITAIQKKGYVHFIIKGENTIENTLQCFQDIYKECVTHNYKNILIEEHLEGKRLGTMDIYDIGSKSAQAYFGFFKAIAYVDIYTTKETISFIENLSVNRSLPLRAFDTMEKAETWLLNQVNGTISS
jgi:hypothetical protein